MNVTPGQEAVANLHGRAVNKFCRAMESLDTLGFETLLALGRHRLCKGLFELNEFRPADLKIP